MVLGERGMTACAWLVNRHGSCFDPRCGCPCHAERVHRAHEHRCRETGERLTGYGGWCWRLSNYRFRVPPVVEEPARWLPEPGASVVDIRIPAEGFLTLFVYGQEQMTFWWVR